MKDPAKTFDALVEWLRQTKAPGFLVGLSGTDSLVTFLAAAKTGKRVLGVHFAPSEDFLYDHPEAEVHLWFRDKVIPWLREQAPNAEIVVDTSIDWRADGQRWGYLMDLSVVHTDHERRLMRPSYQQYWVVGTRNRTEDVLMNYSNASKAVSLQPIIHLWKSEILQLAEHLGAPQLAIDKSCETDCICGRLSLPARHIVEVDELLQKRGEGNHMKAYTKPIGIYAQLIQYIDAEIEKNSFKKDIPYTPDRLVFEFESGNIDVKKFNHFGHLYIAFEYLKAYNFVPAFERYLKYLKPILDAAGQSHRFNPDLTRRYFEHLDGVMQQYPAYNDFGDLVESLPWVMEKITA